MPDTTIGRHGWPPARPRPEPGCASTMYPSRPDCVTAIPGALATVAWALIRTAWTRTLGRLHG